jgi:hypothetical protein
MERSEVSTSVVKWSLSNRVSIIIRIYIDHIWLFRLSHFSQILLFQSRIIVYMVVCFFMLLFNFVNCVFLLLCMFHSGYSVSLCRSVYCLCVNVYCTTATGWVPNCS